MAFNPVTISELFAYGYALEIGEEKFFTLDLETYNAWSNRGSEHDYPVGLHFWIIEIRAFYLDVVITKCELTLKIDRIGRITSMSLPMAY